MQISLEKIVQIVVEEVVKTLAEKGITVTNYAAGSNGNLLTKTAGTGSGISTKIEEIDLSLYKSPVITEWTVDGLNELTGGIKVPKGTIITPKAKDKLKKRNISIYYIQEVI